MDTSIPADIRIREALIGDLPFVLGVYKDAGISARASLPLGRAVEIYNRMLCYPSYRLFVAERNSQIVGTFALLIMDNLAHGGVPSGVVEDVAVLQSFQRQGVGREMMKYAIDVCRERGCYKMTLSTNVHRTGAHLFYESLGFARHGYSYLIELKTENT